MAADQGGIRFFRFFYLSQGHLRRSNPVKNSGFPRGIQPRSVSPFPIAQSVLEFLRVPRLPTSFPQDLDGVDRVRIGSHQAIFDLFRLLGVEQSRENVHCAGLNLAFTLFDHFAQHSNGVRPFGFSRQGGDTPDGALRVTVPRQSQGSPQIQRLGVTFRLLQ